MKKPYKLSKSLGVKLSVFTNLLLICLAFVGCSYNQDINLSERNILSESEVVHDEKYNTNETRSSDKVDETRSSDNVDETRSSDKVDEASDIDNEHTRMDKERVEDSEVFYYVTGNGVRMRENASLKSDILLQLVNGTRVEYIDRKGEWFEVKYDNVLGYIRNDLLSDTQPNERSSEDTLEVTSNPSEVIDSPKIIVKKGDRILQFWEGDTLIDSYPIGLGWEPAGDKQKEGDGRTPEGIYYVCTRNSYSRFYLSLGISYPNKEDATEALEAGLIDQSTYEQIGDAISRVAQPPWNTALGGEIMIHGHGSHSDWTAGCIAVEDDIMDILWDSSPIGTQVIIEP